MRGTMTRFAFIVLAVLLAPAIAAGPANTAEIAGVVRDCRDMGFRMFSFQPAAFMGNQMVQGSEQGLQAQLLWCPTEQVDDALEGGRRRSNRFCAHGLHVPTGANS